METFLGLFLSATTILLFVSYVQSCSPTGEFKFLTYEQSLYKSNLVLYGRDLRHTKFNDTKWEERQDSTFQVFCILKNTNGNMIKENITIHRIDPRTSCETSPPEVGKDYIVLLKKQVESDTYEWAPPKDIHSAKFDVSDEDYLNRARSICGFQNMTVPEERSSNSPACPSAVLPCVVHPASTAVRCFIRVSLVLSLLISIFIVLMNSWN